MASTIQIRVDDDLKTKSVKLFRELGTDTTSAFRMFLNGSVSLLIFPKITNMLKLGKGIRIIDAAEWLS